MSPTEPGLIADCVAACGATIDGAGLLREYDVLVLGTGRCILPRGHGGLHQDEHYDRWGAKWVRHSDGHDAGGSMGS